MTDALPRPEDWIRPEVLALSTYHVPPARGLIKLDAMENPYPWPGELTEAWLDCLRAAELNRYPDPTASTLMPRLREALAVPEASQMLLGNGSDELIQMLIMALAGPGRYVITPEPGFVMYRHIAAACAMGYRGVPLRAADGFDLDIDVMEAAIERWRPSAVLLAYPNNPTGSLFRREHIERILARAPGVVVVDEAYAPFADASLIDLLPHHSNLLLLRTLSKVGLAGLRLGVLMGRRRWLEQIDKVRLPYNIGTLTQISAVFALAHRDVLQAQAAMIRAERERLFQRLAGLAEVTPYRSHANFILFRTGPGRAGTVHEALKDQGILIKRLDGAHPLLADALRVTVGTPAENDRFVATLQRIVAGGGR